MILISTYNYAMKIGKIRHYTRPSTLTKSAQKFNQLNKNTISCLLSNKIQTIKYVELEHYHGIEILIVKSST